MSPRSMPARANLEQLKNQAKDLLKAYRSGQPPAIARFRESLPRFIGAVRDHPIPPSLSLRDAQHVVALEYGFRNWSQLHANIQEREEFPMLEMTVDRVMMNRNRNKNRQQRVVVLKGKDVSQYLPIWVGPTEGDSIASKLQGEEMPRPMTHDLMDSMISDLGAQVARVVVSGMHDDTFFGKIVLRRNGSTIERDSRPSDAIALAVRTGAPVYAEEEVLNRAGIAFDPETGHPTSTNLQWETPSIEEIENEFTEEAKSLLASAGARSDCAGHQEVAPEDILLALTDVPGEVCTSLMTYLGLDLSSVKSKLQQHANREDSSTNVGERGFSKASQHVLGLARTEAYLSFHGQVGPEHILLGLVLAGEGLASQILRNCGIDIEAARIAMARIVEPAN